MIFFVACWVINNNDNWDNNHISKNVRISDNKNDMMMMMEKRMIMLITTIIMRIVKMIGIRIIQILKQ